nr:hypothetical protein HK105_008140 [Polyrhizophydium stewartii]
MSIAGSSGPASASVAGSSLGGASGVSGGGGASALHFGTSPPHGGMTPLSSGSQHHPVGMQSPTHKEPGLSAAFHHLRGGGGGHSRRGSMASIASSGDSTPVLGGRLAEKVDEKDAKQFVGTPDYLAPESILGLGQGASVDWWALGVILYEFLYGIPPFNAATPSQVFENILMRRIDWHEDEVEVSPHARDLMERLMCSDIDARLGSNGAREVRAHPWFADVEWDTLWQAKASFIPKTSNIEDTDYFDDRGVSAKISDGSERGDAAAAAGKGVGSTGAGASTGASGAGAVSLSAAASVAAMSSMASTSTVSKDRRAPTTVADDTSVGGSMVSSVSALAPGGQPAGAPIAMAATSTGSQAGTRGSVSAAHSIAASAVSSGGGGGGGGGTLPRDKKDKERAESDKEDRTEDAEREYLQAAMNEEEAPDFGEYVYKNLPLLEKANKKLVSKIRSDFPEGEEWKQRRRDSLPISGSLAAFIKYGSPAASAQGGGAGPSGAALSQSLTASGLASPTMHGRIRTVSANVTGTTPSGFATGSSASLSQQDLRQSVSDALGMSAASPSTDSSSDVYVPPVASKQVKTILAESELRSRRSSLPALPTRFRVQSMHAAVGETAGSPLAATAAPPPASPMSMTPQQLASASGSPAVGSPRLDAPHRDSVHRGDQSAAAAQGQASSSRPAQGQAAASRSGGPSTSSYQSYLESAKQQLFREQRRGSSFSIHGREASMLTSSLTAPDSAPSETAPATPSPLNASPLTHLTMPPPSSIGPGLTSAPVTLSVSSPGTHRRSLSSSVSVSSSHYSMSVSGSLSSSSGTAGALAVGGSSAGSHGRPLDVLIADDNPVTLKLMESMLTRLHCRCVTVKNGAEAIRCAMGEVKFDVIFMDMMMPVLDGESVARMIKSTKNVNQRTPIIGISSDAPTFAQTQIFDDTLLKPVSKEVLHHTLLAVSPLDSVLHVEARAAFFTNPNVSI